jgi:U3 small nucleolar RNA-associated protein 25
LNLIPKESHGCDFSRVRNYILDGHAKRVRQLICFSHFAFPELNSLFSNYSSNIRGQVKMFQDYEGTVSNVSLPVSQVFYRVPKRSLIDSPNTRFQFFISKILPMLRHASTGNSSTLHQQAHTLIVIPSFFDFTRVRNYLKDHIYNFAAISEYSSQSRVDKSRQGFITGEIKFLLLTERYHFFRRTKLKGIKHVVFYGTPLYSQFYSEIVNLISNDDDCSCWVLFDAFEKLALERIVGSDRMKRMVNGTKDAYMFSV